MDAIGIYVRDLRKDCGYNQADLARITGISEKTIRNIESGRHDSKIDSIAEVVAAIRGSMVHVGRLMAKGATESLAHQLAQEVIQKTGFTDAQREYLESLPHDQKVALLEMIEKLKQ